MSASLLWQIVTRHGLGKCARLEKNEIEALKLKFSFRKFGVRCPQHAGKMLQASPMSRSYSPISVGANRFSSTNELLSFKLLLLGVDWIPPIL
jgi:hypothetical protein